MIYTLYSMYISVLVLNFKRASNCYKTKRNFPCSRILFNDPSSWSHASALIASIIVMTKDKGTNPSHAKECTNARGGGGAERRGCA